MIKLNASVSKKVPLPDVEYSSRSCSAGAEVEVSSGANAEELKEKLRALYLLLDQAVDEQLQGNREPTQQKKLPKETRQALSKRTEGNGNGRKATRGAGQSHLRHCCRAWAVRTATQGHVGGEVQHRRPREPFAQECLRADRFPCQRPSRSPQKWPRRIPYFMAAGIPHPGLLRGGQRAVFWACCLLSAWLAVWRRLSGQRVPLREGPAARGRSPGPARGP